VRVCFYWGKIRFIFFSLSLCTEKVALGEPRVFLFCFVFLFGRRQAEEEEEEEEYRIVTLTPWSSSCPSPLLKGSTIMENFARKIFSIKLRL